MENESPAARSVLAVLAGLAALTLGVACGDGESEQRATDLPLVEAVEVRSGALPLEATVNGVTRAANQVVVRPEISGTIAAVLAQSGEAVERGQALVRIRDDELRDRLQQAEADLRFAEAAAAEAAARAAEVEARTGRTRALAEENLVSDQELETQEAQLDALRAGARQSEARVDQARATVEERKNALAKAVVRSPVAGRAGQRLAEVGQRVDPGTALFVVGGLDRLVVEVPITEELLDSVSVGTAATVQPRSGSAQPVEAELSRVSPFLSSESFSTVGEIDLDNAAGTLRPGMFVEVTLRYGESRQAALAPSAAAWRDPSTGTLGFFVAAVAGAEAEPWSFTFRPAEILAEASGVVGTDALEEGQWVAVLGHQLLAEQARDTAEEEAGALEARAMVRRATWERVRELQSLQREDLLAGVLDKQKKIAAAIGAEIPESEEVVTEILAGSGPAAD